MSTGPDYLWIECVKKLLGVCFVAPAINSSSSIFGFAEFIAALALLVVVYTVADFRYRFRISVAPIPLFPITFICIGLIGVGTLVTDIWLHDKLPVPDIYVTQSMWQGLLGFAFLAVAMAWLWFAFVKPPIFGRSNYKEFARALYRAVVRGSETELPVIGEELIRSARSLVLHTKPNRRARKDEEDKLPVKPTKDDELQGYAHDVLLLLGDRKLCRHLVKSSPGTAMAIFDAAVKLEQFHAPLGQFAKNVSTEAILNTDSILYHEDEGYEVGLLGYIKPFSRALYGNYRLVESLASDNASPLDISFTVGMRWNGQQLAAYARCVLLTLEDYIAQKKWGQHSYALYRAINTIEHSLLDVYKLGQLEERFDADPYQRLQVAVQFVNDAIELIGKAEKVPKPISRGLPKKNSRRDLYDHLANLAFEVIFSVSRIEGPADTWHIHYGTVWARFFRGYDKDDLAALYFQSKLKRLLWDEIKSLDESPNYKNAAILGYCLNVMGVTEPTKKNFEKESSSLKRAVVRWTKRNYLKLREANSDIADACLMGTITFDAEHSQLVKTYIKGLNNVAPKDILQLDPLPPR